jgi:hypothetical protein
MSKYLVETEGAKDGYLSRVRLVDSEDRIKTNNT